MKKPNRRSKQTRAFDASPAVPDEKQRQEKRLHDLERANRDLKNGVGEMSHKLASFSSASDAGVMKLEEDSPRKLTALEEQDSELKKKLDARSQFSIQKNRSVEPGKQFQDEIQTLKAQKVQLQCKMKLESVQFRLSKASMEKEILQLKKEQRRKECEMQMLMDSRQRQKLALHRKTEAAFFATKRLKELLESRKTWSRRTAGARNGKGSRVQDIEHELEVTMKVHNICNQYERQMEEMADEIHKLKLEMELLKEENPRSCLSELSPDEEVSCRMKDKELEDLKEEVVRLGSLLSQMEISMAQLNHREKSKVDMAQTSVSVGSCVSLLMDTSESEQSEGIIAATGKPASGFCCSCTKKSLCKTTKCGCRAAGNSCSSSCGCTSHKCTNRNIVSVKLNYSPQLEITNTTESENLASQGGKIPENVEVKKPPEVDDDCGQRKKPLCDIGNTMVNDKIASKPGHRKKGQTLAFETDNRGVQLPPNNIRGTRKSERTAVPTF